MDAETKKRIADLERNMNCVVALLSRGLPPGIAYDGLYRLPIDAPNGDFPAPAPDSPYGDGALFNQVKS